MGSPQKHRSACDIQRDPDSNQLIARLPGLQAPDTVFEAPGPDFCFNVVDWCLLYLAETLSLAAISMIRPVMVHGYPDVPCSRYSHAGAVLGGEADNH